MTIEIFLSFWQKVSPRLAFPGTQAGDDASYAEWEGKDCYGNNCKFQGMRKLDLKHGVVRTISSTGAWIRQWPPASLFLTPLSFLPPTPGLRTALQAVEGCGGAVEDDAFEDPAELHGVAVVAYGHPLEQGEQLVEDV